jgi:hypothetical protein
MCHHSAWRIGRLVKLDYDVCIDAMKPTNVARLTSPSTSLSNFLKGEKVHANADGPVHDPTAHKDARRRCGVSTDTLAARANSSGFPASIDVVKADITWNDCSHSSMSESPPSGLLPLVFHTFCSLF